MDGNCKIITKSLGYESLKKLYESEKETEYDVWNGVNGWLTGVKIEKVKNVLNPIHAVISSGITIDYIPSFVKLSKIQDSRLQKPAFGYDEIHIGVSENDKLYYTLGAFFTSGNTIIRQDGSCLKTLNITKKRFSQIKERLLCENINSEIFFVDQTTKISKSDIITLSLRDKISWISGVFDTSGTLSRNKGCISIHSYFNTREKAETIKSVLISIGVHSSVIQENNYITTFDGEIKPNKFRVCVYSTGISKLIELGIKTDYLNFFGRVPPNRNSTHFKYILDESESIYPVDEFYTISRTCTLFVNEIIVKVDFQY